MRADGEEAEVQIHGNVVDVSEVQRERAGENVLAMVPMQLLLEPGFMTFVTRANDRFATREITAIKAVQAVKGVGVPATTADDKEFVELGKAALAKLGL